MHYTPVELRHVRVKRALLGYKRQAVEGLLAEITDSFETVWRERHELADRIETMADELSTLHAREQALTQTLVAAEQAATHVKEQAKREAEMILAEAHSEARSVTRNAQSERHRLYTDARHIEALLRGALALVEEAGDGPIAVEVEEAPEASAPQPWLLKVSGGDWVDEG
jgi:cell division initiation protein